MAAPSRQPGGGRSRNRLLRIKPVEQSIADTLFAFVIVSIDVVVLRHTRPALPRSFRTPAVPLVPILSVLACLWLMINLPIATWWRFAVWMAVGFVLHFFYGNRHSRLGMSAQPTPRRGRHRA